MNYTIFTGILFFQIFAQSECIKNILEEPHKPLGPELMMWQSLTPNQQMSN